MKKKFGPYFLREKIDVCTCGEVFRTTTVEPPAGLFATKMLSKTLMGEREKACSEKEVAVLQMLSHENVVKLKDIRKSEKNYYIVLDYCNGGNLEAYQKRQGGRLPEGKSRRIIRQVAQALSAMHKLGGTHRSLGPRKVLLHYPDEVARTQDEPAVRLSGFRYARLPSLAESIPFEERYAKLETIAPEVLVGSPFTSKADIWALGVMAFEMLCGTAPFASEGGRESLLQKLADGLFLITTPLSVEALEFLSRCLQSDPAQRASAEELLAMSFVSDPARHTELDMSRFFEEQEGAAAGLWLSCKKQYDFSRYAAGPRAAGTGPQTVAETAKSSSAKISEDSPQNPFADLPANIEDNNSVVAGNESKVEPVTKEVQPESTAKEEAKAAPTKKCEPEEQKGTPKLRRERVGAVRAPKEWNGGGSSDFVDLGFEAVTLDYLTDYVSMQNV